MTIPVDSMSNFKDLELEIAELREEVEILYKELEKVSQDPTVDEQKLRDAEKTYNRVLQNLTNAYRCLVYEKMENSGK